MKRKPTHFVVIAGTAYDAVRARDGHFYIVDPDYELAGRRVLIDMGGDGAAQTVGYVDPAYFQTAAMAANFIPGVGPIVSSVIQIAGALWGGGDPTPIGDLWEMLIALRAKRAELVNAIAGALVDPFDPGGVDPRDANTGGVLAAVITSEVLGKSQGEDPETLRHIIKRADEYEAIKALQAIVDQLSAQAPPPSSAPAPYGSSSPPPDGSPTPPAAEGAGAMPWILIAGAIAGAIALGV